MAYNVHHVNTLAETEHVSLSHLQLAHNMKEEAKKLEDFREKQKETRKKVGYILSIARTLHFTTWFVVDDHDSVISDRAADGCSPQTEVFTVQENNGCKSS